MSIQAVSWAMKARVGSATRKAVLLVLCNYADADGFCWPSQETVAYDAEMTDRSVRTALAELESDGWIERSERPRRADKTRQSDLIRIVFTRAKETTRKDFPEALPENDDQTIRNVVPNHPEGVSGKPSGEPSEDRSEGAQARPRSSLLPENWVPSGRHVAIAARYGLNAGQASREARRFVLHYRAIGRPLKDWDAAWERWVDRAAEMLGVTPPLPFGGSGTPCGIGSRALVPRDSPEGQAWAAHLRGQGQPCGFFETTPAGDPARTFPSRWPPGHEPQGRAA